MIEINGLNFEQNKKYQAAIRNGYFAGYEESPRDWRHSFVGTFIMKLPDRTATLNRIRDVVGHIPTWEDIDDDTISDFVFECMDSGMTMSSAKTICGELAAVLNANKRKVPSETFVELLKVKSEKSQAVYLTRDEIRRVIDYPVVGPIEQFVRRTFVVQCLTGARRSDAERLTIDNCDLNSGMLSYVPSKTPWMVVNVPVDEGMGLRDLLIDRYHRPCGTNVFNGTVRRICKECRIDKITSLRRREENVTAPKYEFVSSHTGRRSFATNLYLAGVSLEDIAQMMGHGKNINTTKNYICAEREMSYNVMAYFQPKQEQELPYGSL